jgi:ribosomal protein S18 acetylase RimI-like enzyme
VTPPEILAAPATIRQLALRDVSTAVSLVRQFHGSPLPRSYLQQLLANPVNYLIVAEVSGQLAGFLYAHRIDRLSRAETQIFIYEVEVAPEFQRQGIGSALIDHILAIARRDGIETFVFTNHSNKAGVEFYKSTGGIIENGDDLLFVYPSAKDD